MGHVRLAAQCGTTPRHSLRVIRKLVALGFVTKEQAFAHSGKAQCYRVDLAAIKSYTQYVTPMSPITKKHDATEPKGDTTEPKGDTYGSKARHPRHPYKDNKDYKDDKDERFYFIIQDLEDSVKKLIKYGSNVKTKLDTLELLGVPLEAIKAAISDTDFSNAYKVGGLFISRLDHLIDAAKVVSRSVSSSEQYDSIARPIFEPRKCDLCKAKCAYDNSLDRFLNGDRCDLESARQYGEVKKRNGLQ